MNKIDRFIGEYYFLSNFYPCKVKWPIDGMPQFEFQNSEAAFQASKTFNPYLMRQFERLDPSTAKKLGRSSTVGLQMRKDWDEVRDSVMYEIVKQKFLQNPELREKLLATGEAELIEGNTWNDRYWGVCKGVGENHLGKILMKVREELK